MSFVTSRSGDQLLEFQPGAELTNLKDYPNLPLSFSCVIAKHKGKTLFVFNPFRDEWELPAGLINSGETPFDAAMRELREETGQKASSLGYVGLCLLGLQSKEQLELGAIYYCRFEHIEPFRANDEATKMMFWDSKQKIKGYVNEIGIELVRLVNEYY